MEVGLRAVLCEHSCVKAEGFLDQHVFTDIIRQTLGRFIKKCIELTCWEVVVWQWRLLGSGKDLVAEAMTMVRVRVREREEQILSCPDGEFKAGGSQPCSCVTTFPLELPQRSQRTTLIPSEGFA